MLQTLFIILLFLGVIAVTAVVFVIWLAAVTVRTVVRAVRGPEPVAVGRRMRTAAPLVPCPHPLCHASNPRHATFCRRCGRQVMVGAERVRSQQRKVVVARPIEQRPAVAA